MVDTEMPFRPPVEVKPPTPSTPSEAVVNPISSSDADPSTPVVPAGEGAVSETPSPAEIDIDFVDKDSPEKQMGRVELKTVGENIVNGKIAQFKEAITGMTEAEITDYVGDDPEKKALKTLFWITQKNPTPAVITDGSHFFTLPGDPTRRVVKEVLGSDGDMLICNVDAGGLTATGQKVPKALLQDALIIEHADSIKATLPEAQQKAFDQYIATLKSGDVTVGADELHTLVKESAVSIGLPTGEVLANFTRNWAKHQADEILTKQRIEEIKDPIKGPEGRARAEAEAVKVQVRAERIIADLELQNMGLLDGKTIAQALIRTGSLDQVTDLIKDLADQDVSIKTQLKDKELTKAEHMELELKLAKNQLERKAYKAALDALDESKVGEALQEVVDGKVPPEITKALGEAMASGDMNKLIEVALKVQSPSEDDVTKARNKAHRDEIAKKLGKTGGIAALAMAIMMYAAMKGTDKAQ